MRKENLISMVEDRKAELIDLVSRLIRINSENPTGTQREVVDFVEKYLEKAGIAYEETGENPDYPCVVARMGSRGRIQPDFQRACGRSPGGRQRTMGF